MGTGELIAAGVGVGDEVVLPSYGGEPTARVLRAMGAVPVFADIDANSYCLDPASVEAVATERTAAVVPVHLFGHPADMVCLHELAQRRGVRIVEFDDPLVRVPSADAVRRQQCAAYLDARLTGVIPPYVAQGVEHSYEQYVVRVPGNGRPDRDAFKRALRARGVSCHVPIQTPAHRTREFRADVWLPETERAADQSLALPIQASMTRRELQRIVSACNALGGLLMEPAC
ncbi:DegT/DnrJ/EryC1/StrS family aminotransferase [Streptomyces gobiensis]|uniref:DegT/DnrJ/EryC1/StrS family aminotransferase n=1 Tax=Streptomyces gobiensis TaxID=2875706 RepID=UPI001E5DD73F|nr:DegT/DnrJ/EryC1/StrS family aminotransferase [Streptomyces gobiensis]UGY95256.1 DegT/DnrJ/EryC1/StrS family aminotransferase [Streptomyces gobiensis]